MSQIYKSIASGPIPPSIATTYHTDSGDAIPALNILNVYGDIGCSTSGTGNTVTIKVDTDSFDWSDQAISFAASPQNGYFCTGVLTVTLPTASLVNGSTVIVYVDTASVVTIQAGAGQSINVGSDISAVSGTAVSTAQGSTLTLVYRVSDLTWHSISSLGTWIVT